MEVFMRDFEYAAPTTLKEAITRLAQANGAARPLAGGSDLIDQMRVERKTPSLVVDVKHIPELNRLEYVTDEGLHIGAAVPCAQIYSHPQVKKRYPAIASSCALVGDVKIQNRASMGGNFCNAAPSADTPPAVIVLGGSCVIAGLKNGRVVRRKVAAEDFFVGPGQTVLQPGELLVEITIPPPESRSAAAYQRFIPRNEMDIAIAGVASWVRLARGKIAAARIALAAVAPTPLRAKNAEAALIGKELNEETLNAAGAAAAAECKPIDDVRGSAWYRRELVNVLTRRTLKDCRENLME
jgi:carbon-monoxide dehydrogenase medium subunit